MPNTNPPLVSVVVPSYNHARFITQCIEGIINQSYTNYELIVIDDGSTDETRVILAHLQKRYGFTFILQENMGLPKTFNKALQEHVRGKYFTFCASDDYWVPDKLEKQVGYLEQNSDIPMCYGKVYAVDESGNILQNHTNLLNSNLKGGHIFEDLLLINFHLPVNYMLRRSIFDEVGYYREDIFTEDLYMNLRIASKFQIGYIDDYLFYYRVVTNCESKPVSIKSSVAHLKCIEEYKSSEFYRKAITKWHLRNFIWYSSHTKYKLYACNGMFHSMSHIFSRRYLISCIRLILSWN